MNARNLDVAVTGGTVHDGTGAPPRTLDVGIQDGRIVVLAEPGSLPPATEIVDATGSIVTPGFIDPHTHMDAQLFWAPSGSPSLLHGVTSIAIGSCGFGIAPLAAGTEEFVLRSLEAVEEIPYSATRVAVPMTWTTWPEYIAELGRLPLGLNVVGFVPHSALRTGLGIDPTAASITDAEMDCLRGAYAECLEAGGVGLSTSRGSNHTDALGRPMSSRQATDNELRAIVADGPGHTWQINIAAKGDRSEAGIARAIAELASYVALARETSTRVTWTPLVVAPGDRSGWRRLLDFSAEHADVLLPQVAPQSISSAISFDGPSFASMIDGWAVPFAGYGDFPVDEKRTALASVPFRAALRASKEDPARITAPNFDRWRVAASPSAPELVGLTLREAAESTGSTPVDVMLDLALADDLRTVIEAPLSNLGEDDDAVRELVTSPATIFGLGDAGAHVKSITNYTYPSYVLGELAARRGWLTIEDAVRRLTSVPAGALGLRDRGVVREAAAADLCVIELERLSTRPAELVKDLPGGASRLHAGATGFRSVIVNGSVAVRDDAPTGAATGRMLGSMG